MVTTPCRACCLRLSLRRRVWRCRDGCSTRRVTRRDHDEDLNSMAYNWGYIMGMDQPYIILQYLKLVNLYTIELES